MSGVPVVIVPKGGVPVREVTSGAPVMTVADNGFGTPITLTPLGAPFIVQGGTPPADIWSPFTITAGTNAFGWGYAKEPIVSAPIGSISNEPYTGSNLISFFEAPDDSQIIVCFSGDVTSQMAGYSFQINGTTLPVLSPPSYDPDNDWTIIFIGAYFMLDGQNYNVERVLEAFDPLAFFEGTAYAGRLYDYKRSAMFTDAGVTPAAIGQPVYRIQDRTGGQNSEQTTSSLRGLLRADGVEIDGLDDFYPTGWAPTPDPFTVIVCAYIDPATAFPGMMASGANDGAARTMLYINTGGTVNVALSSAATGISAADNRGTVVSAGAIRTSGANFSRLLNGAQVSTGTGGDYGVTAMHMGARNLAGTANSFLKGRLRGFIAINRVLTPTEIADIHTYWSA